MSYHDAFKQGLCRRSNKEPESEPMLPKPKSKHTPRRARHSNNRARGAHAFEACADGSLIIYATMPDGDGERIRIEPQRVRAVLAACGDALARKASTR